MIELLSDFRIQTENYLLRPIVETDITAIYAIHSDDEVNRYLPYQTWQNWADAERWYARVLERRGIAEAAQFVILRRGRPELVGTAIAFDYLAESNSIEIGYVLARANWGQGVMTEILRALLPALADRLTLSEFRANVDCENTASLNLLAKLGFQTRNVVTQEDGTRSQRLTKTTKTTL
ncbi:N-acetyltransferase [Arenicella chitinivorans]|uniref:N-acetyltransferase n=1 Tax=Arenicella chitinivorans TaxID=1329800 RepID=A0A918S0V2_9GAMM|nr:GNAT family N-acetyltransferase [Arenicella chitinivorans]GHA18583.1 N-acetyltransferase [Arenicella chitinivorans]